MDGTRSAGVKQMKRKLTVIRIVSSTDKSVFDDDDDDDNDDGLWRG